VSKQIVQIDSKEYPVDARCLGCEWLTPGMICTFAGSGCDFPWTVKPHECPKCKRELPPQTWCPDCEDSWAWPVGGRDGN